MINVDVNDKPDGLVKLWFKHETSETKKGKPPNEKILIRHKTICKIMGIDIGYDRKETEPTSELWTMAEGVVNLYPKDRFSRRIGRKEALKKALASPVFTREVRTIIWNEYFKHCKR